MPKRRPRPLTTAEYEDASCVASELASGTDAREAVGYCCHYERAESARCKVVGRATVKLDDKLMDEGARAIDHLDDLRMSIGPNVRRRRVRR